MNAKQMLVLAMVLIPLVGGLTIVKIMLPKGSQPPGPPPDPLVSPVTFLDGTNWPETPPGAKEIPIQQEAQTEGHHDFPFQNDTDQPLEVSLSQKSCTCTQVLAGIAPNGEKAEKGVNPGPNVQWRPLEPQDKNKDAKGLLVPPKGNGWVRMSWKKADEGQPRRLQAIVYVGPPEGGHSTRFDFMVYLLFVDPVRLFPSKEQTVGTITDSDQSKQVTFHVWSSTREAFSLEPEPASEQRAKHPFVTVAKPVPMTADECREMGEKGHTQVRCGYAVTVTVHRRLTDGRSHDMGPFSTSVALMSDAISDPVSLTVAGTVQSDINVTSDGDTTGRIRLGLFSAAVGTSKTATIDTDPTVQLTLDRKPDFMEATLKEERAATPDRKTWNLTVTVPPKAINGPFPSTDHPSFSDTAIYLKTQGNPPRRIRIPVSGTAGQR